MRIDDRNAAAGSAASRASDIEQANATQGKGSAASTSRLGGDSVQLSGASQAVRSFNTARSARLEQLSKAVQNGTYSPKPALISRALVGETISNGKN